jgi:hypothetical protein
MPETNEREALAVIIAMAQGGPTEHGKPFDRDYQAADAILASDWLKTHTAAAVEAERAAWLTKVTEWTRKVEELNRKIAILDPDLPYPDKLPGGPPQDAMRAVLDVAARKAPE